MLHSRTFQNISMIAILFNAVWITYLTVPGTCFRTTSRAVLLHGTRFGTDRV